MLCAVARAAAKDRAQLRKRVRGELCQEVRERARVGAERDPRRQARGEHAAQELHGARVGGAAVLALGEQGARRRARLQRRDDARQEIGVGAENATQAFVVAGGELGREAPWLDVAPAIDGVAAERAGAGPAIDDLARGEAAHTFNHQMNSGMIGADAARSGTARSERRPEITAGVGGESVGNRLLGKAFHDVDRVRRTGDIRRDPGAPCVVEGHALACTPFFLQDGTAIHCYLRLPFGFSVLLFH